MKTEEFIFAQALQKPSPQERSKFLETACEGNSVLRRQVDALLEAHERAGAFLETPPAGLAGIAAEVGSCDRLSLLAAEQIDSMVGAYELVERIGEGGMGVVFVAEQQRPMRRRVALKIIKPGMDSERVIARFEAERQALAMMDHPNIARVLDGGTTPSGRPYFVMELVGGSPITGFCDANRLALAQRLELFTQVCNAVEHAHHKGVIHRDLKPSNVLVSLHDGKPVAKVIDFGVAKATRVALTERAVITNFPQSMGTPKYMSPEQADGGGIDVDTRSDVYSLGVLLYELLTGTTPFANGTAEDRRGEDDVRRLICETDSARPSACLNAMPEADRSAVAANRAIDPAKLRRLLRGDLDWVVLKALEKDPGRRYQSVGALAADVKRYLEHEPVVARPPGTLYRLGKLVRKHKLKAVAAAGIFSALLLGTVGLGIGMIRAGRERDAAVFATGVAQENERKAAAISQFLQDLLESANPWDVRHLRSESERVTIRKTLDAIAKRLDSGVLAEHKQMEASLRARLAGTYMGLSLYAQAIPHQRRCLELLREIHQGRDNADLARRIFGLAGALLTTEPANWDEAERLAREGVQMRIRLYGAGGHGEVADGWDGLVGVLSVRGDYAGAEEAARNSLAIREKIKHVENGRRDHGRTLVMAAPIVEHRGDREGAIAMLRKALSMYDEVLPREHPQRAVALESLGRTLERAGRRTEALERHREGLQILRGALDEDARELRRAVRQIANLLRHGGQYETAEELLLDHYQRLRRLPTPSGEWEFEASRQLLELYRTWGKPDQVEPWKAKVFAALQTKLESANASVRQAPDKGTPYLERAKLYARMGRFDEAEVDFVNAIRLKPGENAAWTYLGLLKAYRGQAREWSSHCEQMLRRFAQSDSHTVAGSTLMTCLIGPSGVTCDIGELERLADRVLDLHGTRQKTLEWARMIKGITEYRAGRYESAVAWLDRSRPHDVAANTATMELFLAMAHQKLGRGDEARLAMARAVQTIQAWTPQVGVSDLADGSIENWFWCQLARREAEEILGPVAAVTTPGTGNVGGPPARELGAGP